MSLAQTHSSQRHVDLEDKDRAARLHRVQSNPGDRGVTWELAGQTCCPTMAGLGQDKMESEHVTLGAQVYPGRPLGQGGHPGGCTSSGPWPLAPRAKTLSQLGSPQPRDPPSQAISSSDVPGGVMKRRTPPWECIYKCSFTHRLDTPKSKYQDSSGRLAVPVGLGTRSFPQR